MTLSSGSKSAQAGSSLKVRIDFESLSVGISIISIFCSADEVSFVFVFVFSLFGELLGLGSVGFSVVLVGVGCLV